MPPLPSRFLVTLRLFLLPVFVLSGFIAYGFSLEALSAILPPTKDRALIISALVAQGFLAASILPLLFSRLLVMVYRQFAAAAALIMTIPVLWIRLSELANSEARSLPSIVLSAYDIGAHAVLLVLGTWLVSRKVLSKPCQTTQQPVYPAESNSSYYGKIQTSEQQKGVP